jgi:hypothetical protein
MDISWKTFIISIQREIEVIIPLLSLNVSDLQSRKIKKMVSVSVHAFHQSSPSIVLHLTSETIDPQSDAFRNEIVKAATQYYMESLKSYIKFTKNYENMEEEEMEESIQKVILENVISELYLVSSGSTVKEFVLNGGFVEMKYTLDGKVIPLCDGQKDALDLSSRFTRLEARMTALEENLSATKQELAATKQELVATKQEVLDLVMGQKSILKAVIGMSTQMKRMSTDTLNQLRARYPVETEEEEEEEE